MTSRSEPPLNPPEDPKMDALSDSISDASDTDIADEIISYGLEDRCHKDILFFWYEKIEKDQGHEISKFTRKLLSDLIEKVPFADLVGEILDKEAMNVIRELLLDYKYNLPEPEKERDDYEDR